jgi:two-component system heavy metal sensor histidine kinase CusS
MLAPLAAFWLAGRATRPLADILHTAERLRPTRLGDRLPIRGNSDELDRLAKTINGLLDSVASHVDQQEQFVTDAAHELRGPLAALQSSLEVAVSQDQAPADRQELLTDMLEAARHLSKVANDLLILAEAGSAARPATHGPVDVGGISRQAIAMFAGVAEECGIALSLDATGSALAAGDPVDLRRLLSNLLDNAIRFTRPGGRVEVKLVDAPASSGLILTVSDTGTGIAPRDLDHVFDRFFKADPARSHGGSGRSGGLGLAICRSIVESSGGTIGIASRLGEGTTVTVRLPSTPLSDLAQPLRAARVVLANATDRHR